MDVTSNVLCTLDLGDKIIYGLHSDTLKKELIYTWHNIFYLCDKILSEGNLMQEGRSLWTVLPGRGAVKTGAVREQREMNTSTRFISPFIQSGTPANGMLLPTMKMGLLPTEPSCKLS